jgi:hypothetical protein
MENEEAGDYDRLAHLQAQLEAEATALFEIGRREGRSMTEQEWTRSFEVVEASNLITGILARRAERQRRVAGSPPPIPAVAARPRRPVQRALLPRRTRVRRRTAAPLATRTRGRRGEGARRAAPAKEGGDPDPAPKSISPVRPPLPEAEGDPARILGRFVRARAWALLSPTERRQIVALINHGLTPGAKAAIDHVFARAAIARGEHPGCGESFFAFPVPTRSVLTRDRLSGLWRFFAFDPAGSAGDGWETGGTA